MYYKLRQFHYKLGQWVITNHCNFITNYGKNLLEIRSKSYCKLRHLLFLKNSKVLQFTSIFITYYGIFKRYYKLRQILLQITAGITN